MPFIGNQPTAVPLTGADLTDGIITTAKIANDAVNASKFDETDNYTFTGTVTGAGEPTGLKHLSTTTVTSATGYVSFPNIFTTDYDYYRCHWSNMRNTSGGYAIIAYLTDNVGSQVGSGQMETVGGSFYGASGVDNISSGHDWSINYIKMNSNGTISPSVPCSGYIDIANPRDSVERITYMGDLFFHDGTYHRRGFFGGCLANSTEVFGIEFSVTGGALNTGTKFSVFGYRKS